MIKPYLALKGKFQTNSFLPLNSLITCKQILLHIPNRSSILCERPKTSATAFLARTM